MLTAKYLDDSLVFIRCQIDALCKKHSCGGVTIYRQILICGHFCAWSVTLENCRRNKETRHDYHEEDRVLTSSTIPSYIKCCYLWTYAQNVDDGGTSTLQKPRYRFHCKNTTKNRWDNFNGPTALLKWFIGSNGAATWKQRQAELRFLPTNRLHWFPAESPSSWLSFTKGHKKFCAGTELNCARIVFWWYGITAELKVPYGAKIIILLIPWTQIKCFQENQTALGVLEHTDTSEKLGLFFFF